MFVFGAIDFAAAVARVGKFLGYHVTVCDARGVFATRLRFPEADEVVVSWPHRFLAEALEQGQRTIIAPNNECTAGSGAVGSSVSSCSSRAVGAWGRLVRFGRRSRHRPRAGSGCSTGGRFRGR